MFAVTTWILIFPESTPSISINDTQAQVMLWLVKLFSAKPWAKLHACFFLVNNSTSVRTVHSEFQQHKQYHWTLILTFFWKSFCVIATDLQWTRSRQCWAAPVSSNTCNLMLHCVHILQTAFQTKSEEILHRSLWNYIQ